MSARKVSDSMRLACYGLAGWKFAEYPNKRTAAALVRRGLARWVGPGEAVLALTDEGRHVATAYGHALQQLGADRGVRP